MVFWSILLIKLFEKYQKHHFRQNFHIFVDICCCTLSIKLPTLYDFGIGWLMIGIVSFKNGKNASF